VAWDSFWWVAGLDAPVGTGEVIALAARGDLVMPVRAYPFAEVVEAHRAVESRHGRGKVVLVVETGATPRPVLW
jgi:hypothetical protein